MLEWYDVSDAAGEMFKMWVEGGDLEWAEESWDHLLAADMLADESLLDTVKSKCHLITLAVIYLEFAALTFEEDVEPSLTDYASLLEINLVALGVYWALAHPKAANSIKMDENLTENILRRIVERLRSNVYRCLLKADGNAMGIYLRMAATASSTEVVDDDDDDEDQSQATVQRENPALEITGPHMRGLQYVECGFHE